MLKGTLFIKKVKIFFYFSAQADRDRGCPGFLRDFAEVPQKSMLASEGKKGKINVKNIFFLNVSLFAGMPSL